MQVTPVQTPLITPDDSLESIITEALPNLAERSILVVTSKIIAVTQGETMKLSAEQKDRAHKIELARQFSEWYLEPLPDAEYVSLITVTQGVLGVMAGIDGSNTEENTLVPLPSRPYVAAEKIWQFLREHFSLNEVGVVITDTSSRPLRWGVVGTYLSYAGMRGIRDMRGTLDLFGHPLKITEINMIEPVAAASVLCMGEAHESQPLCVVSGVPEMEFLSIPLASDDRAHFPIQRDEDLYAALLTPAPWKIGGSK